MIHRDPHLDYNYEPHRDPHLDYNHEPHRDPHHEQSNLKPTHTTYPATIVNANLDLNPLPPPPPLKSMIVSKTHHQKNYKKRSTASKTQTHGKQIPDPQQAHPRGKPRPTASTPRFRSTTQTQPNIHPNADLNTTQSPLQRPSQTPTKLRPKRYSEQIRIYKEKKERRNLETGDAESERG